MTTIRKRTERANGSEKHEHERDGNFICVFIEYSFLL